MPKTCEFFFLSFPFFSILVSLPVFCCSGHYFVKYAGDVSGYSRVILIQAQAGLTNSPVCEKYRVLFYNTTPIRQSGESQTSLGNRSTHRCVCVFYKQSRRIFRFVKPQAQGFILMLMVLYIYRCSRVREEVSRRRANLHKFRFHKSGLWNTFSRINLVKFQKHVRTFLVGTSHISVALSPSR